MEDSEYKPPATFSLFMRAPAEVRFEENNSRIPAIIVCDTANAWVYSPPLNRYRMQPASESTLCSPIVGDWKSLPITLKSLELAGHRKLEIGGKTIDCQMVRGKSEAKPPLSGEIKRELCVDANSGLIVWEEEKFSGARRTYTYTKIDRDIVMAADVFMPVLPPGSQSTPYELPMPVRLGFPIMGDDSVVSMPRILSKRDPVYDEGSRQAHVEGTVILYIVVDAHGLPAEIDVYKHLSPALDASAVQAVRTWRFTPAMRNNRPIAVGSLIEINFKRI